jgi:two-component system, chemotaxis family, CheB/CheR fusion protein
MPNRRMSSKPKSINSDPSNLGPRPEWCSVLDKLPDGLSVHSPTGEIEWANERLCELYDRSLAQIKGLTTQEAFGEDLSHYQSDKHSKVEKEQFETGVSGRVLLIRIEPIRDDDSRVVGFLRIARDVTGEHSAKSRLERAERLAALGQMLFGIAHSVGTPLNIISGYSEFLLMRAGPDPQGRKELSVILDQTRRIASLFGEALDMARLPTNHRSTLELKTLILSTLELASHHLRNADVKVEVTCVMEPPLIYGEAPQLKQAFFNLIVNAASEIGSGGRMEILLDQARENCDFVTVAIRGTQTGGTAHDFSKFVNWFSSPIEENSSPGLGLFLLKQILDTSGARIGSNASGEGGVSIVIELPVSATASSVDSESVHKRGK